MLQTELNEMQQSSENHGAKIYYVDIYGPLFDMVQYPEKYGEWIIFCVTLKSIIKMVPVSSTS